MIVPEPREDPMDAERFPIDPWRLVEKYPSNDDLGITETLFATANGYLGIRATPEETRPSYKNGTFINGFHETWEIKHAENAFGFAKTGQTLVNAPSSHIIKLYVDDEPLIISMADLVDYERSLDFRDGVLRRNLIWRTPSGKRVQVRSRRMVSLADRHLALMTFEVTMLEGDAPIVISSQIVNQEDFDSLAQQPITAESQQVGIKDPRKNHGFGHRVLLGELDWCSPRRMILGYKVANSGMTLGVGADHQIITNNEFEEIDDTTADMGRKIYRIGAKQGEPILISKAIAYHTSRSVPVRELSDRVRRTLDRVRNSGFEQMVASHKEVLDGFWRRSDVQVGGDERIQQAVRWCLFELAQAGGRSDGLGIPAKGVTGDGYEGHYFWDSEVYVIPFLSYTNPIWARNALRFRYTSLRQARERAREMSVGGALFPWRTINGEEASAYYAAGTAQYHIDAAIAYSIGRYWDVTGDTEFIYGEGAELLIETARMWADLGFWRGDTFEIHGVTGPDEYTTVVNNNMYTNVMAKNNLDLACKVVETMHEEAPEELSRLRKNLNLRADEIEEWAHCAEGMKIPYDEQLGIHLQDDVFIHKELWDIENTPKERFPLLLHYHPLVIYRFQVLKQADVVLANFLLGNRYTREQKRADFEYYDPITTGDSSLSVVVQSIVAAEVGHQDMAYEYFLAGLYVDLADLHHNASDGVHIASAGGVWHSLACGFAGMRQWGPVMEFDPRLPRQWDHLQLRLTQEDTLFEVRVERKKIRFEILEGTEKPVRVRDKEYLVMPGVPLEVELKGQGVRLPNLATTHPIIGGTRPDGSRITAEVPDATESIPRVE